MIVYEELTKAKVIRILYLVHQRAYFDFRLLHTP